MTPDQAKDFFSQKIVETARRNSIDFDDLEREMLYWSSDYEEKYLELGRKFSEKHNDKEYEKKVAYLLNKAYAYDGENNSNDLPNYKQAYDALHRGDHYLLVLLNNSIGDRFSAIGRLRLGKPSRSIRDYLFLILVALIPFVILFVRILIRVYFSEK